MGQVAVDVLIRRLPNVVRDSMLYHRYNDITKRALQLHVQSVEDQEWLRCQLTTHNLVAFVVNGAILPRMVMLHLSSLIFR
jgi:predicted ABC-class ATPase